MKIICLGDLHLLWDKPIARRDEAHEVQKKKFKFVLDWARKNQAAVIQPGDFFDTARSWHLTSAYMKFLDDYYTRKKLMDIYVVYGQHDTYMYSEKTRHATGLGLLVANRLVHLLDHRGHALDYASTVWAYGASFGQPVPRVGEDESRVSILVVHKMIVDEKLWATQEDYVYAEDFLDQYGDYDLIVCGDCHRKFAFEQDGRYIVDSGPLFRKEADAYNMTHEPGFYVYDTDKRGLDWVGVPHEPASEVLSREHLERQERINLAMEEFISSMHLYEGEEDEESVAVDFMGNLQAFLQENDVGKGVIDVLSSVMDEELRLVD